MPRPERALDPDGGVLARWAADLRELRLAAGNPGYRELARLAHFSPSTLSDAAAGQKLPSLAVTLGYVRACGGDVESWQARWTTLAAELASTAEQPTPVDDCEVSPYQGLATFQTSDADRFFGRASLVRELIDRVGEQRFVAVFGPSGSGKSSLLRAGVVPALAREGAGWPTVLLTPGEHPLGECAIQLGRLLRIPADHVLTYLTRDPRTLHLAVRQALADAPDDVDLVLVVDQFEEIFSLCADHAERAAFVAALVTAVRVTGSRLRVVLGIRADFYGRCAEHPELVDALRDGQVLVGAMRAEDLRAAIVEPARRVGLTVEATLVSTIISEMVGRPGALPLMSHALVETWRRRRGTTLSLAGYQASGGIDGAIQQTAETVYHGLTTAQRQQARELLLRLTAVGQDTADTRRRVPRAEFGDDPAVAEVLDILAAARLITVGEDSVEIAHEALIRSWRRLRDWLDADREGLRLHRQLTDDAHTWESLGRDTGALYRGVRLAAVCDWNRRPARTSLTDHEQAFLDASIADRDHVERVRRRRVRRRWILVACLAVAVCLAGVTTVVAVQQRQATDTQRAQALSRELAGRARDIATSDPSGSVVLALAAWAEAPTVEARGAVLSAQTPVYGQPTATWAPQSQLELDWKNGVLSGSAISANGRTMATYRTDGTVHVIDPRSGRTLAAFKANGLASAALSSDGHQLATRDHTGPVRIWNTATGTLVAALPEHAQDFDGDLAFSPDGRILAMATVEDDDITLWDTTTWRVRSILHHAQTSTYDSNAAGLLNSTGTGALTFAPDNRTVAWELPNSITVWDIASDSRVASLIHYGGDFTAVAFGRDRNTVVAQSGTGFIALWDTTGAEPVVTLYQRGNIYDNQLLSDDPDRGTVMLYTPDGAMTTWQTDLDVVLRQLCRDSAGGAILPDHWNQIAPGIPRPVMCANE